jgi:hypothetical protein
VLYDVLGYVLIQVVIPCHTRSYTMLYRWILMISFCRYLPPLWLFESEVSTFPRSPPIAAWQGRSQSIDCCNLCLADGSRFMMIHATV